MEALFKHSPSLFSVSGDGLYSAHMGKIPYEQGDEGGCHQSLEVWS